MANFSKSFNFRSGVQVDDDNFIVNSNGLIGIGTTVPITNLDVRGEVYATGIVSTPLSYATDAVVLGFATITSASIGILSVTSSGIVTATSGSGIVTYFGDGGRLLNLPTSQWLDRDVGLGFTSIYAQGFVGIATIDPRYILQIGGNNNILNFQNGVGINSSGDILATGIITASNFSGSGLGINAFNAENITVGTISSERLPIIPAQKIPDDFQVAGIITALTHFSGNIVGIASTALDLPTTSNITIRNLNSNFATIGVSTVSSQLDVYAKIGVQTSIPQSDIHIVKTGIASAQVTGTTESSFFIGRSANPGRNSGGLKFGNVSGLYPYSSTRSLDIINTDTGNINHYLHYGPAGVGTGNYNWLYSSSPFSPLMTLTYQGNLGLGATNPSSKLEVNGTLKVLSSSTFESNVTINNGNLTVSSGTLNANVSGSVQGELVGNVFANSGISTFNNVSVGVLTAINLDVVDNLGISTNAGSTFDRANINAISANAIFQQVSIGSTFLVSAADFSNAGSNVTIDLGGVDRNDPGRYMVVPKITSTQRGNLYSDTGTTTIQTGSVIYNTTLDRFQGRTGVTGWTDFVMGSGGNISVGVVTATSGAVSGDLSVGVSTAGGVILTAANGNRYRLFVTNAGLLSTVLVP
jgi:hypothetical protein